MIAATSVLPWPPDRFAAVEHAVLGIDLQRKVVGAGVGAGRMARDQVQDFQLVLDRAQAGLERAVVGGLFIHLRLP
jgi:hypothetical protein